VEIRESRWHVTCSILNALMLDCHCPRNGNGLFDALLTAERCYSLDDEAQTADASHGLALSRMSWMRQLAKLVGRVPR